MAPSMRSHARSHNLLLVQKVLNLRDGASPLTLVLDTLEQSAAVLVQEYVARAKIGRSKIVYVTSGLANKALDVDVSLKGRGKTLEALQTEIISHCPTPTLTPAKDTPRKRGLIIVDSLNSLASCHSRFISAFLSSIISPVTSVVAVYHTDVPLVLDKTFGEYEPHPLTVLCHLATAVLRVSSLYQAIERQKAENRSQQEPVWGLQEGREGVLIGVKTEEHGSHAEGIVLDMDVRRRSGRTVTERFVLRRDESVKGITSAGSITLLSGHPSFATPTEAEEFDPTTSNEPDAGMETTFNLGLTDKQRRDREGIVLPYFDAQTDIGAGEGGRILYEMGREDDFDEEEDEV